MLPTTPNTKFLILSAHVVYHVLRTNAIPIARDCIHLTLLLYLVTYFILSSTQFNVAGLLIYYIKILVVVWCLNYYRKSYISFGHLHAFILEVKYIIFFSSSPDHIIAPMLNTFFSYFLWLKNHPFIEHF